MKETLLMANSLNRRQFLKGAAVADAAPLIIPASALARICHSSHDLSRRAESFERKRGVGCAIFQISGRRKAKWGFPGQKQQVLAWFEDPFGTAALPLCLLEIRRASP